ncbi:MAG: alpha-amylase [Chloroflexi bacterium]|nr:alpha-amylase [Chloroflexota bacterium]
MAFSNEMLATPRPSTIRPVALPRRAPFRTINEVQIPYYPSPVDWASQVLYFLLPDRFSDGLDHTRPKFDRAKPRRTFRSDGFRWDHWAESGGERWQGGTLRGIQSRLDYLSDLGITALWIGPIFKQRHHSNEYHGYAIQDFLDVDAHFGARGDLVELVAAAHARNIRIILDVIFNHTGHNWDYEDGVVDPPYRPWPEFYNKGAWLDEAGQPSFEIHPTDRETGVWPRELQDDHNYTRAGKGSLGGENIDDDHAEMKRTDFDGSFRDLNLDNPATLNDLARCYKYWIALADLDGMRLDTLKHVSKQAARNFCGALKEFAANLGKTNFFLVGEVGGPDDNAGKYLDALELNLNATLDIGDSRIALTDVAKGLSAPSRYFGITGQWAPILGSHRNSAHRHVKVVDDHDHVFGAKVRFSTDAATEYQIAAAVAIQLFTLGIPCIYYGTEQAFAGPEQTERAQYLPDFGRADKYLRETMFGAEHPRKSGAAGLGTDSIGVDATLPGFGAFGTVGCHFFDPDFHVYRRIRELIRIRQAYPALQIGRQYLRFIRNFLQPFTEPQGGELITWSRILDEEEVLCIVNGNGVEHRGADVIVDSSLNASTSFRVIANTAELTLGAGYAGTHKVGDIVPVQRSDNMAFVEIRNIPPSETVILTNR